MPPRKLPTSADTDLGEQIEDLTAEMQTLRAEVRVLWEAIDELRDALEHALRNPPETLPPPFRLWSMPLDPTAPDFAGQLNAVPPEVISRLRGEATGPAESDTRGRQTCSFLVN